MANDYMYLSGKSKWARLTQPNKWGKWAVDLYMDQENIAKVKALKAKGLMNKIKMDDDGEFCTLSRPTHKEFIPGTKEAMSPVAILGKDGNPVGDVPIGNGSDLTCKMVVYPFGPKGDRKVAMRLEAVRIDNLIKFGSKDFTAEESKTISGMAEQPEPMF